MINRLSLFLIFFSFFMLCKKKCIFKFVSRLFMIAFRTSYLGRSLVKVVKTFGFTILDNVARQAKVRDERRGANASHVQQRCQDTAISQLTGKAEFLKTHGKEARLARRCAFYQILDEQRNINHVVLFAVEESQEAVLWLESAGKFSVALVYIYGGIFYRFSSEGNLFPCQGRLPEVLVIQFSQAFLA